MEDCFPQMQHVHILKPRGILCGTKDKILTFLCKSNVSMSVWVVGEMEGEKERVCVHMCVWGGEGKS